ncbi:AfsR/SARP family transcriptional regulator [Actinomadura fulvescens]|uniref:OmpR/PhoB-type domain-containing protein n=1 Tax=Actinomadura fulvescens TaxID=46160 RepID=A0ABP6CBV8_9ACTN
MLQIKLLGTLSICSGKAELSIEGLKRRSVLAALIVRSNSIVPLEELALEVWRDEPPPGAENALQAHISRIRSSLSEWRERTQARVYLRTRYPGYVLEVPQRSVDIWQFRHRYAQAHAVKTSRPEEAVALYRSALALWRGPALQDVPPGPITDAERGRLARERLMVVAGLAELDLAIGRHLEIIPDLEQLVLDHPLEERLYAQLMVALARAGRTGDALQVYQHARLSLAQEAGLSPSPALQRRMRAILEASAQGDEATERT